MIKRLISHPRYEPMVTFFAICYILLLVGEFFSWFSATSFFYKGLDLIFWGIFVFDYLANLFYTSNRKEFVKSHIFDLIAILPFDQLFGFLQLGRIARLFRLLRLTRVIALSNRFWDTIKKLLHTNGLYKVLILNISAVLISSLLLSILEKKSIFDSLWWSIVTMTTVGYGDIVPQDAISKAIAIILMLVGICTFGMVTSTITRFFTENEKDTKIDLLLEKLENQEQVLKELSDKLDKMTEIDGN
ncbi:ion transporter [Streptococcus suis]|nr:ion transporter [Streptococcus suis]